MVVIDVHIQSVPGLHHVLQGGQRAVQEDQGKVLFASDVHISEQPLGVDMRRTNAGRVGVAHDIVQLVHIKDWGIYQLDNNILLFALMVLGGVIFTEGHTYNAAYYQIKIHLFLYSTIIPERDGKFIIQLVQDYYTAHLFVSAALFLLFQIL